MRRQPTQHRSQQRVERILDAAAAEFVRVGYDAATTNRIAVRAETSIGSLYQFFPNKRAVLAALAERYLTALALLVGDPPGPAPGATLRDVLDPIVDHLVDFSVDNPGFVLLLTAPATGGDLREASAAMREAIVTVVAELLRHKHVPAARIRLAATVCVEILRALLPLAVAEGGRRKAMTAELKAAVDGYLSTLAPR